MFCLPDVPPFLFVQKTKAEDRVSGYYEIPEHPSLEKVARNMSKEGFYEELQKPEELFRQISNIQQQQQQQQQKQRQPSEQGEHHPLVNSKQKEQQEPQQQQPCCEEAKDYTREGFYEEFGKPREYLHLVNNNNNNNQNDINKKQQLDETENTYEPVGSSVIRVSQDLRIAGN